MSLNKEQRRVTSEELKAHFHESTLSLENIAEEMNISVEDVEKVLNMDAPNGFFGNKLQKFIHLVWDIRDLINNDIKMNGATPKEYTYLKGEKEDYWFLQ
ncbi:Uncharacterized protein conserved in bacteria [Staphylococcus petrasii]|uniref:DUF2316 family protein n=1 Tax=Staphylococcus petrasii TaxID=1276936 RepID=A0A380FW31_9STAP|nr:DUF2316 family protein [Staphylococcus petrasii]MCI2774311.1 DUF2316 family protein [Staphylococcus petrasii]PNZ28912.1 DUF2316 domain-containing protein [Staphylococcus petrasii]TGE13668.1 DUF2316 family protein [Staphylococcus petrasii]TGE18179.1 DUF2316 family protein [Staphylococcus petrasii]SUM42925.1 Uncharacterized protein conserved in bacteria [Staphylococcus petrasii]